MPRLHVAPEWDGIEVPYPVGAVVYGRRASTPEGDSIDSIGDTADGSPAVTIPREVFERLLFQAGYVRVGVIEP